MNAIDKDIVMILSIFLLSLVFIVNIKPNNVENPAIMDNISPLFIYNYIK